MAKVSGPDQHKEWEVLREHCKKTANSHLREMFRDDPDRGSKFALIENGLYFDYSKNLITGETIDLLLKLAEKMMLKDKINRMFRGEKINITEDRAVLHTALRDFSGNPVFTGGVNVIKEIEVVRDRMRTISDKIREGKWSGFSGKQVKNIINIGIGGSDLGPRFVCNALRWYSDRKINIRFISNIDGTDLVESLNGLNPDETVFIVASKTFTTAETMTNARSAKVWIKRAAGDSEFISKHFIAVTSSIKNAELFGIPAENTLLMSDWVGGRYSLTSSIGLAVMISIGYDSFISLLKGFYRIDDHFRNAPFRNNIPVIMGLLGIMYNNFFGYGSYAILPYDEYLSDLPAYLQQCDMESNGKSMDINGTEAGYHTGPVVWGGQGTNCQHAFAQLLHQGSRIVPADFIGFANPLNEPGGHHTKLIANLFAQTGALAFGRKREDVALSGVPDEQVPFRIFPGNRPSNTLLFNKLTPETLGMLIALYEHKIFTQGAVWNINSFDQWGVELGKKIAADIESELEANSSHDGGNDSSTRELIGKFRFFRETDEGNKN